MDSPRLAVALFALLGVACGRAPAPGRSVILVTIDTTRADRIGAWGHPWARTPVLDRLARQGALFRDAIADVPVTLPSHSTMFTGVPALGHGVRFNADFRLGPGAETLAEVFRSAGFATGAVVSSPVLDAQFGLDQGFDSYDDDLRSGYAKQDTSRFFGQDHWLPKAERRADEAVDLAIAWLRGTRRPFFLWMHVYDPHFPYDPPAPWGTVTPDPYLAEIESTDRELARLVRAAGDAVIAWTSDHGEGLDDHREDEHGIFVYDETVRVPLAVRAPGVAAGTLVSAQVRTIDLAPTLLALAGLPRTLGLGKSLLPRLSGADMAEEAAYCESVKTKLLYGGSGLKAIRTGRAKFVWAPAPELYDLELDPGETRNLLSERPDEAAHLRAELERLVSALLDPELSAVQPANADEETLARLASLGYVGRGRDELEWELPGNDPKDLVDVTMGAHWIQNGFVELGESKLLRFLETARRPEDDPGMARLWAAAHQNLAKVRMLRSDYAGAAEEYLESTRIDPTYENARWSRIYALNLAGDSGRAVREADALLERTPNAWRVRFHRALGLALLGHPDAAVAELGRIAEEAPESASVARNAAWFLARLGGADGDAALRHYLQGT